VWGCKQQARNADEWRKHWDLTADDDDSLSPLTRCRRVPLVHELLWLTVGWSRLANRAVRLERSLSSIERKLLWSRWQQKHGWTYQKAEFVDKHSSRQYNRYKSHRLATCLRPLNYVVLFTTITRRFKVRPYSTSNIHQLPWRHQLEMVLWLNSQQNRLLQCKQWHEANASKCVRPFIGASDLRPYILYITYI